MPGTILVADTDALVVRAVGAALQAEGYEVLTAAKASDALKTWGSGAPDLILVDVCAPIPEVIAPLATEENLRETVRRCEALDRRVVSTTCDVRSQEQVDAYKAEMDRRAKEIEAQEDKRLRRHLFDDRRPIAAPVQAPAPAAKK